MILRYFWLVDGISLLRYMLGELTLDLVLLRNV